MVLLNIAGRVGSNFKFPLPALMSQVCCCL